MDPMEGPDAMDANPTTLIALLVAAFVVLLLLSAMTSRE